MFRENVAKHGREGVAGASASSPDCALAAAPTATAAGARVKEAPQARLGDVAAEAGVKAGAQEIAAAAAAGGEGEASAKSGGADSRLGRCRFGWP